MNTYKKSLRDRKINYRKIFIDNFGPIPKDEYGRSYEIHHIDGNHKNNNPSNLKAIPIQEHYDIHYSQCDFGACLLISKRMNKTVEEMSMLGKLHVQKMISDGTHPFLDKISSKERAIKRTAEGKNAFSGEHGSQLSKKTSANRIALGTHNLTGASMNEWMLKNNIHPSQRADVRLKISETKKQRFTGISQEHPSQLKWCCENCGHSGKGKGNKTMHYKKFCMKICSI